MPALFHRILAVLFLTGLGSAATAQEALSPDDWDQVVETTLAENFPFCSTGPGGMVEGLEARVAIQVMLQDPDAPDMPVLLSEGAAAVQRQIAAGVVIADADGVRLANCPTHATQLTLQFRHQANELLLLEDGDRAALLSDIVADYGCVVSPEQEQPFFVFALTHIAAHFDLPPPAALGEVAGIGDFFEAVDIFLAGTQRRMIESGALVSEASGTIRLADCEVSQ
jgi:hypothetical protein